MADKLLMNKNTLATLKAELSEYREALPVFEMKEQQLMAQVRTLEQDIRRLNKAITKATKSMQSWVAVMAESQVELTDLVAVDQVITEQQEMVGVRVEVFQDILFKDIETDTYATPLWVDAAKIAMKDAIISNVTIAYKKKEISLLEEELAEARRMKNALKEVFIPETKDHIRKIEIYLGDVERLAIGCAKLVKKKKMEKVVA